MMRSKLARLRQLDLTEIAWRSQGLADIWRGRIASRVRPPRWDRGQLAGALRQDVVRADVIESLQGREWHNAQRGLAAHFATRAPRFLIAPSMRADLAAHITSRFPSSASDASARAEKIIAGRYDILGYQDLPFDGRTWHHDPVHRKTAPRRFWSTVPYLAPECGDHKIIWEVNRHQHWMTLGRAYWLTGDERYRDECLAQLASWVDANPPLVGINWASMLELGLRAIAWTWALHFFARADADDRSPWIVDLLLALDRQLSHVERHLSYYFSPNTHLMGEALALYVVSRVFPELKASARREDTGRRVLLQESTRQVAADGGHCERSTHYHRYTLDFYLLALAVARLTDDPVANALEKTCARLGDAARALTDDTGRFPHLGDDDGGMLMPLTHRALDDMRDSLAIAAVLTGRTDLVIDTPPEEVWWVLGNPRFDDARTRVSRAPRAVPPTSVALPETGYYVSRHEGDHLVIDGGPHGYMNAGHAHADALSLTFSRRGTPLLVDTGTGCYTVRRQVRDRFRSTALHNTLTLDNRSQSVPRGPFHWQRTANGSSRRWRSHRRFDYFVGTHDGYAPVAHYRHVLMLHGDVLVVADHVGAAPLSSASPRTGRGDLSGESHTATVHWHIDPAWSVTVNDRGAMLQSGDEIVEFAAASEQVELFFGSDVAGLGWYSPVYGHIEPTSTLRLTTQAATPLWIVSVFGLDPTNRVCRVSVEPITGAGDRLLYGATVRVDRTRSVDRVVIAEPVHDVRQALWRAAHAESDAAMVFDRSVDGAVTTLAIVDVTTLRFEGTPALNRMYPSRVSTVYATPEHRTTTFDKKEAGECAELLDSLTVPR